MTAVKHDISCRAQLLQLGAIGVPPFGLLERGVRELGAAEGAAEVLGQDFLTARGAEQGGAAVAVAAGGLVGDGESFGAEGTVGLGGEGVLLDQLEGGGSEHGELLLGGLGDLCGLGDLWGSARELFFGELSE